MQAGQGTHTCRQGRAGHTYIQERRVPLRAIAPPRVGHQRERPQTRGARAPRVVQVNCTQEMAHLVRYHADMCDAAALCTAIRWFRGLLVAQGMLETWSLRSGHTDVPQGRLHVVVADIDLRGAARVRGWEGPHVRPDPGIEKSSRGQLSAKPWLNE
jgi:hypothetical protein